jgi:hypothetical protein
VKSKDLWVVIQWKTLDIFSIDSDFTVRWSIILIRRGELVIICESSLLTVFLKNSHETSSIVVIGNSTTVVDVTRNEEKCIPWNLILTVHKQLEHGVGCLKIRVIELIFDVPAEWSELSSLLENGMEE